MQHASTVCSSVRLLVLDVLSIRRNKAVNERHSRRRKSRHTRKPEKKTFGRGVLILGHIRELALYRAEVLRARGFNVATPRTKDEMTAAIRRGNFDVAVLSYTLPNDTVEELAELMHEYCQECALVAIN
jgi:hypothetical protein